MISSPLVFNVAYISPSTTKFTLNSTLLFPQAVMQNKLTSRHTIVTKIFCRFFSYRTSWGNDMRFRQFKIFFICTFFRCRLDVQNKPFVQPFFIFQSQYLRDNFFAVFNSEETAKTVPHKSGYPDALNGNCFLLKICYSVVIFVFPLSRFQTRVCLLRFQTISVLPAIMPGQANLSRNPEFP